MRTSYIKDETGWKGINQVYIKDNSTWNEVKETYVKDGEQWRLSYVKDITTLDSMSVGINTNGLLDISLSGGDYGVSQPTDYKVFIDNNELTTVQTSEIIGIPITAGDNRVLKVEVYRGDYLLYNLTRNLRLFTFTGGSQSWSVPSGIGTVMAEVQGAKGGRSDGGLGGRLKGLITVTPGETLNVYVGGQGQDPVTFTCSGSVPAVLVGGFNGGGSGGRASDSFGCPSGTTYRLGASGGGATDIRRGGTALANRVIVAGGGGGGYGPGGSGNGAGDGGNGFSVGQPAWPDNTKGFGGTTTAGGAAGGGIWAGTAGALGVGGNGAFPSVFGDNPGVPGGGGGGLYGGGGGGANSNFGSGGSGGGGSGFITGGVFEISSLGYRQGNGIALLSW
jgi:hypothetical protein